MCAGFSINLSLSSVPRPHYHISKFHSLLCYFTLRYVMLCYVPVMSYILTFVSGHIFLPNFFIIMPFILLQYSNYISVMCNIKVCFHMETM
jgi:hypothetical protein